MIIPHDSLQFVIIIVVIIPIIVIPHVSGTAFFIYLIFYSACQGDSLHSLWVARASFVNSASKTAALEPQESSVYLLY
jgi:hypothetical protein